MGMPQYPPYTDDCADVRKKLAEAEKESDAWRAEAIKFHQEADYHRLKWQNAEKRMAELQKALDEARQKSAS